MRHVFIIGSKGIPAKYGGYETFVDKLTESRISDSIKYHVTCAVENLADRREFEHNGAHCHNIAWRPLGAARAVFYDLDALEWCIHYIEKKGIENPIVYVLACRVGPFFNKYVRRIHKLGGMVFVNPDGHEWMRAKWSTPIRWYWKISEAGMVRHADLTICDSLNIEKYIQRKYEELKPRTRYIAYGADIRKSKLADDDPVYTSWLEKKGLVPHKYYLVVGRFVPENNYETMIREFMTSSTSRDFALITGIDETFLCELQKKTGFKNDPRIKFVGTVYDQDLLKKIRENAFAYLHGHQVGGTNPSLLEALASTHLNLLLDVGFNREVARDSALYWSKDEGSLAELISKIEGFSSKDIGRLGIASTREVETRFSWPFIVDQYEKLFEDKGGASPW